MHTPRYIMTDSQRIQSAIIFHEVNDMRRPIEAVAAHMELTVEQTQWLLDGYRTYYKEDFYYPIEQYMAQKRKCRQLLTKVAHDVKERVGRMQLLDRRVVDHAFHMPIRACDEYLFNEIRAQVISDTYLPEGYRTNNQETIIKNKKHYL